MDIEKIDKIMKKRKPSAEDLMDVLMANLIVRRLQGLPGTDVNFDEKIVTNKAMGMSYRIVTTEEYWKIVFKANKTDDPAFYQQHKSDSKLYDVTDELMGRTVKAKADAELLIDVLIYLLKFANTHNQFAMMQHANKGNEDVASLLSDYGIPIDKLDDFGIDAMNIQKRIAENIREVMGFNYFVEVIAKKLNEDDLNVLQVSTKGIKNRYNRFVQEYNSISDSTTKNNFRELLLLDDYKGDFIDVLTIDPETEKHIDMVGNDPDFFGKRTDAYTIRLKQCIESNIYGRDYESGKTIDQLDDAWIDRRLIDHEQG